MSAGSNPHKAEDCVGSHIHVLRQGLCLGTVILDRGCVDSDLRQGDVSMTVILSRVVRSLVIDISFGLKITHKNYLKPETRQL